MKNFWYMYTSLDYQRTKSPPVPITGFWIQVVWKSVTNGFLLLFFIPIVVPNTMSISKRFENFWALTTLLVNQIHTLNTGSHINIIQTLNTETESHINFIHSIIHFVLYNKYFNFLFPRRHSFHSSYTLVLSSVTLLVTWTSIFFK